MMVENGLTYLAINTLLTYLSDIVLAPKHYNTVYVYTLLLSWFGKSCRKQGESLHKQKEKDQPYITG